MDPQQWEKVKDLFELGELMSPAEREDLLAKEPDEVVRKEAARLLKINPVNAFIDQPVMSPEYLDRFTGHAALLSEGEMLGTRYKIEKRIASGGMGDVYSAYDKDLRERIAIKTIRQDIISNPAIVSRFRREISLARRVAHPNVCKVYDLSQEKRSSDGRTVDFLTMELVEGETLSQWLKREAPVGFEVARPLLEQICAGLAAAHDAGVVHRDFKGSNVLIAKRPDGSLRAAVTDFGLARSVSPATGASHESSTGLAGGTPAYMAPEQMEGRTVGPKADLYALGIVMYEMATGTAPHTGDSPLQIAVRRVTEKPQSPRKVNPDIDPSWEEAILRCLEYKPEDRPADARAVAELFGKDRPLFTVPRWRMPRWLMPALAGVAAVLVGVWWWTNRPPEHSEEAMRWYRRGTDLLMDGAFSSAKTSFEKALQFERDFGLARARLADALFEMDRSDDAKRELARASSANRTESLLIESLKLSINGRFSEALERMDSLVRQSRNTSSLLDRARILERAGRLDEAIGAFQSVLERDPENPAALLHLVELRRLRGGTSSEEALKLLQKAESSHKASANLEGQAAVMLAKAPWLEKKLSDAEAMAHDAWLSAERASSATLQVRAGLAQARYAARMGEMTRAQQLAAASVDLAKRTAQVGAAASGLADLAYIDYLERRYPVALGKYREALDIAEAADARRQIAFIKRSMGDVLSRMDRIPEAIEYMEQAQSFFAANGLKLEVLRTRQMLADCDWLANRIEKALESLRAISKEVGAVSGSEVLALRVKSSIAQILWERGEYPEAQSLFSELVAGHAASGNKPKEQLNRIYAASVLTKLGRIAEAKQILTSVLASPANAALSRQARLHATILLQYEGKYEEAVRELRTLQGKETTSGDAVNRQLCNVLAEQQERLPEAEKACAPLVAITPEGSSWHGLLLTSLAQIAIGRGQWGQASALASRAKEWSGRHGDPEVHLFAHILLVAASSKNGRMRPDAGSVAEWKSARAALETRWGKSPVDGMANQLAFRRYRSGWDNTVN